MNPEVVEADEAESRWRSAWELTAEEAENVIGELKTENASLKQQLAAVQSELAMARGMKRSRASNSLDEAEAEYPCDEEQFVEEEPMANPEE